MIVTVCVADKVTPTNRVYSKELLQAQVDRLKPIIDGRGMLCELGPVTDSIIHFTNVSHSIEKLWMDDDKLMAEVKILSTPAGQTLQSVLNYNPNGVGFKMVGVGNGRVDDQGILQVGSSYKLVQIEAVLEPGKNLSKQHKYRSIDDPWLIDLIE
jgi:hypothetical protein